MSLIHLIMGDLSLDFMILGMLGFFGKIDETWCSWVICCINVELKCWLIFYLPYLKDLMFDLWEWSVDSWTWSMHTRCLSKVPNEQNMNMCFECLCYWNWLVFLLIEMHIFELISIDLSQILACSQVMWFMDFFGTWLTTHINTSLTPSLRWFFF